MPKTIEEISRETGCSITTVRLVVNGQADKYRISKDTQKKVRDYVNEHGYSINHAARSLKLKRSETIGFVAPDLANPFFARLMAALEVLCRQHGLVLLTASSLEDPELEKRAIHNMLARGVDGIVSAPCQPSVIQLLCHRKTTTPAVLVDRDYPQARYPTVVSNNHQSSLMLTHAMLKTAQAPVHFLCGHSDLPSIQERIAGFSQACLEVGIADWSSRLHIHADDSNAAGRQLAQHLLNASPHFPAFMCSSLLILEGVLQQLKIASGQIRPDILIGTFDDHSMLDFLPNQVLSIKQDETAIAALAFARLQEQMQHGTVSCMHNTVPCELIRRN